MTLDIAGLRALIAELAPGPWEVYDPNEGLPRPLWCVANDAFHNPPPEDDEDTDWPAVDIIVETGRREDADFIAAARDALPAALDEIERLQAEVERLTAANANLIHNAEVLADELVLGTTPEYSTKGNDRA